MNAQPALGIARMRGWTMRSLAAEVGAHEDWVSLVLRGVHRGSPELRARIAGALGLPVEVAFLDRAEVVGAS